jgi:prepilin peptidase CpaA
MIATLLLLALTTIAAVTDVRWRKIYNHTTYPGIVAAVLLATLQSALTPQDPAGPALFKLWSPVGWDESLLGLAACGGLMLVCFVLFNIGGGDVKLVAMMGAFLGLDQGLEALLWTFILGGCLAVCALIWRVGALELIVRTVQYVKGLVRLGPVAPIERDREILRSRLYLGPCALAAVVLAMLI